MGKRVVITGMGALTPVGNSIHEYLESISSGKNGVGLITKFNTEHFKTKFACELKGFVPENHFDRKELRKLDPFCQYALVAAEEAVRHSGIEFETMDKTRAGVIWSSAYGGVNTLEEQVFDFVRHGNIPRFTPFFLPRMIINIASALIAIKYGLKGINYAPVAACASSNVAILDGFNQIRLGNADVIVCGGSEAAIAETGIGAFNAAMALSTNNEEFETACRPFDTNRDGFVMAEGACGLILEELDHAKSRGAAIYAEIIGGAMTCDAYHITAPHPDGEGVNTAMKLAIRDARIDLTQVDYINGHATSTPLGDLCELKAIADLFGEHAKKLSISATKSMTGHLLGAAGAAEAIVCVNAVKNDLIAPTINTSQVDPLIPEGLNLTLGVAQKREVNIAMNNTFGFGGQNVITLFKKYIS
jgi:3-oxoacyl-[acyl-carrier-protein] synthase II